MPGLLQLVPFNVKEQQLYFELSLNDRYTHLSLEGLAQIPSFQLLVSAISFFQLLPTAHDHRFGTYI